MFRPPRCPNRGCPNHRNPVPNFFIRHGFYRPNCRAHPVPRFRCRACKKTFSRQTFRMDYRDHKPHLNRPLFDFIVSGVGLRQAARKLRLSRRSAEMKFRKIGRHLRELNRNTRPLSVPTLIERKN